MAKFHEYIYNRANNGKTFCYGKIQDDSNFHVVCSNEEYDGIAGDIDAAELNTWKKICEYLYKNYRKDIEQIETC
tara:strand:+ start:715 stop:939 length:225 start_codon:yes stop_codon:yes gene_type:complete